MKGSGIWTGRLKTQVWHCETDCRVCNIVGLRFSDDLCHERLTPVF
ncbi:hypothetical protein NEISICOT_03683 [Neisseria sicca ATCC 29256]|uniref:Uncharacterized protein n=1 Tax=Neisseria sicca ATCC 29256 TaxID=547045 RepID=C6MAV2_NEISI|nr:hypothetical protein NEISICOT_03683 [Neisseria sicca ATCC 29256]